MSYRWPRKSLIPFAIVMVLFMVSLGFSFRNTLKQEGVGQLELSHLLWAASQLEVEHLRFLDTLNRFALDKHGGQESEIKRRFDILWSRPVVLMQGNGGQRFRQMEGATDLVRRYEEALREMEPRIFSLKSSDSDDYHFIRSRLVAFTIPLHDIVRTTFHASDSAAVFRNRELRDAYIYMAISLLGILISSGFFIVILGRQVRKANHAEQVALEARRMAETASRAKGDFLANMSHELRTPLNAIIGFAEIMRLQTFGPMENTRYKGYVDDIHSSGSHLLGIIGDILDTAKIEAGKLDLDEEDLDVAEVAETAMRLIRPHATEAKITLHIEIPKDFPGLRGDKRLIRQMVVNLLSNAVKFTPAGGRVSFEADMGTDGQPLLRVRDTGIGMSEHEVRKALSPFGQIDPRVRGPKSGTGLGLPLVLSFAELHGARLEVISAPGHGTLAVVVFPAERIVAREAAA